MAHLSNRTGDLFPWGVEVPSVMMLVPMIAGSISDSGDTLRVVGCVSVRQPVSGPLPWPALPNALLGGLRSARVPSPHTTTFVVALTMKPTVSGESTADSLRIFSGCVGAVAGGSHGQFIFISFDPSQ
jgi:hypothetical protein